MDTRRRPRRAARSPVPSPDPADGPSSGPADGPAGGRVGVVAPLGRDAELIASRLSGAGLEVEVCAGVPAACERLHDGAVGVLVLTSEAVRDPGAARALRIAVGAQPSWSDVPVVLLAEGGLASGEAARLLGNVGVRQTAAVLERPVSSASLVGTVHLAMLARRRQLEVRDLVARLEEANATLEARVEARTREVRRLASELTLAEQEERRRIAYLLHDDLQQRLYGVGITLTVARGQLEPGLEADSAAVARLLDKAEADVAEAASLTRSLSHDMSPPVLRGVGLDPLFEWLRDWARDRHGLVVEADGAGVVLDDEGLRVLLYQVLRELLFNTAKHAGTDRARLEASAAEDGVRVRVEDEGGGFDPDSAAASSGLGLGTVRERLELVGGRVELASAPGRGTCVTLLLPTAGDGSRP